MTPLFSASSAIAFFATASIVVSAPVLTPIPVDSVKIEDRFWSPKIEQWYKVTLNDVFDKFEAKGAFANFDRVAAKQTGGHRGEPWWDGLVYESITGASDLLIGQPDGEMAGRLDGYVKRISAAAAADPDGYVNTGATLDHIGIRWNEPPAPGDEHDDNFPHTIYNAGCLVEAGIHYYRATGDMALLKVATRMANYMSRIMGPAPKQNIIPGHAVAELAFTELYQLYHQEPGLKKRIGLPVREEDYLKLAEFWIEARGHSEGRKSAGAYNQDDVPVFRQPVMEGHAVRSALLATGIAATAAVNGRKDYEATATRWWKNMAEAKMYLTGGLGSIPGTEGFGPDYDLPNDGYMETCASVAGGFFSHRMNLLTGDGRYVDVLERELYNGALSGVSQEGNTYFYTNFLSSGPEHRRWNWMGGAVNGTPCCPPMFLKLQGALSGMIYATGDDGIYVNLYVGSRAHTSLSGERVEILQNTLYPWDGEVNFTINLSTPDRFSLHLRLPDWAKNPVVEVNGAAVTPKLEKQYLVLEREWKPGDQVALHLPMPVERVKADPRTAADVGRVALMRGPVVYCAEGVDNGGPVTSLKLDAEAKITPDFKSDLLGGVMVLRGQAERMRKGESGVKSQPVSFTAIPFYANSNRQPTDMEVWIADDASKVRPLTLAGEAAPSASHCFSNDSVQAMNDGLEPSRSDDESIPRMTWWDHRGTAEWAQLDFPEEKKIIGVDLYWWDESRLKRDCRVPQSWTLQYLGGTEWKPVPGSPKYGVEMDAYNSATFPTITTRALRLQVQLQQNWSAGILEWKVRGQNP